MHHSIRQMKMMILLGMLFSLKLHAEIKLPKILGDGMVLQRNTPVAIWGYGRTGETVSVSFANQVKKTTVDQSGKWKVILDPLTASVNPSAMTISGSNIITLVNVLVGEVWLCSGQSNMEYTMRKNSKVVKSDTSKNSPIDELDRAANPAIRIFLVTSKNLRLPDSLHKGWSIAKDSALRAFSAAGYFFARRLYEELRVPIGVISAAVPGSAIEPWLTGTIVSQPPQEPSPLKLDETKPGKFYPTMIQPLAPFAIKGFLWYQGETNCFQNENIEYTYKMQALINGWRKLWNDRTLPFYYVQIAPFYYSKSAGKFPLTTETLPLFWEAQTLVSKIPNTGMIVTTDLINTPDDLHPGFKWEIGKRLAVLALAKTYHKQMEYSGPVYKKMIIKKDKIELDFANTSKGLTSSDGKPLTAFTISGADGKFLTAEASIIGDKVVVSSPAISNPVNVRFEWNEMGKANFYNKDGFPAVPFRTDSPLHFEPGN